MTISITDLGLLTDIDVQVTVELGEVRMRLRDVCGLAEDSVVMLDRLVDDPLDLLVNGKMVARGEVVAQGNRFGLRIIELAGQEAAPVPSVPSANSSAAKQRAAAPGAGPM